MNQSGAPLVGILYPAAWAEYGRKLMEGAEYDILQCGHRRERKPSDQKFLSKRRCPECGGLTPAEPEPIPIVLHCPSCHRQHVDAPEPECGFSATPGSPRTCHLARGHSGRHNVFPTPEERPWNNPPHRSHFCHFCGETWRPADVPTVGVRAVQTRGEKDTWPRLKKGKETPVG
jgi:hypothetical protein